MTFFLLSQDGDSDEGWGSDVSSDDGQGVVFVPEPDVDPFAPPAPPAADAPELGGMQGSGRDANKEAEGEEEDEDEVKRLAAEAERMEREAKHCMRYLKTLDSTRIQICMRVISSTWPLFHVDEHLHTSCNGCCASLYFSSSILDATSHRFLARNVIAAPLHPPLSTSMGF